VVAVIVRDDDLLQALADAVEHGGYRLCVSCEAHTGIDDRRHTARDEIRPVALARQRAGVTGRDSVESWNRGHPAGRRRA
jgi:hypothetical protein